MKRYDSPSMYVQGKNQRQEIIDKLRKLRSVTKKLNFRNRSPVFKNIYETPKRVLKNYPGNSRKSTSVATFRSRKPLKKSVQFKKRLQPRALFRESNMYF